VRGLSEDRKLLVASFYQVPELACFVLTDTSSATNCLRYVLDTFATVGKSISGANEVRAETLIRC